MTPEQLKASILQQAMEGKLVKQDPNDEPASVLLDKIKAEKEQLIKEKKIKKTKALPPISDEEIPFDIPDSWEWVRLGDISDYIQRGRSPKYDKENNIHPIISQKCIQWDEISLDRAKYITDEFWQNLEDYRFIKKGDILWNSTGLGTVGRLNIVKIEFNQVPVDSHVTIVRANNYISKLYLYYYLCSPEIQINLTDYLTGSTKQKELGLATIMKIAVPLPPLEEQKRIVAKIEELLPLVDEYAKSYNQLQDLNANIAQKLKQSILQDAMEGKLVKQNPDDEPASVLLEKIKAEKEQLIKEKKIKKTKALPAITDEEVPFDIPDSWEWVRLGDISNVGMTTTTKPDDISLGVPLIELADIESYTTKLINNELTTKNVKSNKFRYNKGDVLFAKLRPYLKKILIAPSAGFCTSELLPINGYLINNYWLRYGLLSKVFFDQIKEEVHGINLPRVNPTKMKSMILPLPPLEEQKRIVAKIEKLFKAIDESDLAKLGK